MYKNKILFDLNKANNKETLSYLDELIKKVLNNNRIDLKVPNYIENTKEYQEFLMLEYGSLSDKLPNAYYFKNSLYFDSDDKNIVKFGFYFKRKIPDISYIHTCYNIENNNDAFVLDYQKENYILKSSEKEDYANNFVGFNFKEIDMNNINPLTGMYENILHIKGDENIINDLYYELHEVEEGGHFFNFSNILKNPQYLKSENLHRYLYYKYGSTIMSFNLNRDKTKKDFPCFLSMDVPAVKYVQNLSIEYPNLEFELKFKKTSHGDSSSYVVNLFRDGVLF